MTKKLSSQIPNKYGLCLDWETSGATWGGDSSKTYQGLSFGAIVFDTDTFDEIEKIYVEIKFDESKWKWSPEAEKVHGLTKDYLAANGVDAIDAACGLAELIMKYWGTNSKVMFLGHNPEFDIRFTNQLLNNIDIEFSVERKTSMQGWIQLHHVILDTSALGYITLGLYKSDLLFDKIGFPERGDHNALADAEQTLLTCKAIRELVGVAMNG